MSSSLSKSQCLKQILHETKLLQLAMENGHTPIVTKTLKRVLTILKTLVAQIDILETMTPVSFASLRERLQTASGFQSIQFRELEFVLGYRRRAIGNKRSAADSDGVAYLKSTLAKVLFPDLWAIRRAL